EGLRKTHWPARKRPVTPRIRRAAGPFSFLRAGNLSDGAFTSHPVHQHRPGRVVLEGGHDFYSRIWTRQSVGVPQVCEVDPNDLARAHATHLLLALNLTLGGGLGLSPSPREPIAEEQS